MFVFGGKTLVPRPIPVSASEYVRFSNRPFRVKHPQAKGLTVYDTQANLAERERLNDMPRAPVDYLADARRS
jgi:hypothetical protein